MTATVPAAERALGADLVADYPAEAQPGLSVGRNLKIGLFHLGSGMADVITTGVWNRIMISDLGFSATPIGLLVSLRYFLAPLGVWAGRMSDQYRIFGTRRLFWVWLGRAMMALSTVGLGVMTASLARGAEADALHWLVIAGALLLFSVGSALSGSTFLALIYDRARADQRGRAVGIVWTFLLLGLTFGGVVFALLLPGHDEALPAGAAHLAFTPETLLTLFIVAALAMAGLWFISIVGEEKRGPAASSSSSAAAVAAEGGSVSTLRADLALAWKNRRTRAFFWFLALSMFFAFSQDLILEPFAGDVHGMDARITTRFTAYWGSMAILGTIVFLFLSRRIKALTNTVMNYIGVSALVLAFALFALSSLAEIRGLVTPGLIVLGIGLGVWNVGTLGLMMDMSPFGRAGTFLGFWTLVVTLARGGGVSGGGVLRDLGVSLFGSASIGYGFAFGVAVVGLLIALYALSRVDVRGFQSQFQGRTQAQPTNAEQVFAAGLD
ncbi:MAG: BCD family MFS transporter [Anaerolinea sp.]|nr:BCD family MFS transporter [Anaerolinea sp.]